MIHGSATLSELASVAELFWENKCEDIPLGSICDIINVSHHHSTAESRNDATVEGQYRTGTYFYRLCYDRTSGAITRLPKEVSTINIEEDQPARRCLCCDLADEVLRNEHVFVSDEVDVLRIMFKDVEYHEGDCVYLLDPSCKVLRIGQIRSITVPPHSRGPRLDPTSVGIEVDLFGRYDELLPLYKDEPYGVHCQRDERRLFCLQKRRRFNASDLEGRCIVQELSRFGNRVQLNHYKDESIDNFWVSDVVSKESARKQTSSLKIADLETLAYIPSRNEETSNGVPDLAMDDGRSIPVQKKIKALVSFSQSISLTELIYTEHLLGCRRS